MSTITTTPGFSTFLVPIKGAQVAHSKSTGQGGKIERLKVFRSGSFRDSMGVQRTWETEHLEQMVFHYTMLRDRGTFPNVPVREGHRELFGSGGSVIGYFDNLYREREGDIEFLFADLDLTEPEAFAKWERGTFRARSLEVGMYEDNNDAPYWPVVMGVAFVDIPAVEGLYSKPPTDHTKYHFAQVVMDEKENLVSDQSGTGTPPAPTPPAPPAAPAAAAPPAAPAAPPAPPAPPAAPTAPAPAAPVEGQANHSAPTPGAFAFSINGQPTHDYAAVQAHIATLEGVVKETTETNRKAFVEGLAHSNKIAATQVESLTAIALGLSADQFTAFSASYEAAPKLGLFGQHGVQDGGTPPASDGSITGSTTGTGDDDPTVLEARVKMHRQSGMSEDKVKETSSYKRLVALGKTP